MDIDIFCNSIITLGEKYDIIDSEYINFNALRTQTLIILSKSQKNMTKKEYIDLLTGQLYKLWFRQLYVQNKILDGDVNDYWDLEEHISGFVIEYISIKKRIKRVMIVSSDDDT